MRSESRTRLRRFPRTAAQSGPTLPSLKVPVAVHFKELPAAICALARCAGDALQFRNRTVIGRAADRTEIRGDLAVVPRPLRWLRVLGC